MKKIKWPQDERKDYETEEEFINAYPDYPCVQCGCPGVKARTLCPNCGELGPEWNVHPYAYILKPLAVGGVLLIFIVLGFIIGINSHLLS